MFRFLVVFAVLTTQLLMIGCDRTTPEQMIAKAEQAYEDGKIRGAIVHLKSALQQQPDSPRARWLLSEIYLGVGDGDSAEKELERARRLGVSEDAVLPSLAKALLLQNENQKVLELKAETQLSPTSAAEVAAAQAVAASRIEQSEESLRLLEVAKRLAPDVAYVAFAEALVNYAQDNKSGALVIVDKLLVDSPRFMQAWTLKGDILRDQLQYGPAEQAYTQSIKLQVAPVRDLVWRSLMRVAQKDLEGAKKDAKLALKAKSDQPEVLYLNGLIAFEEEDFDAAQEFLERSHSADTAHFQTRVLLAATDLRLGNTARALQLAESIVVTNPGYLPIRQLLSVLYLRERDGVRAEEMMRPVVAHRPKDLDAKNLLAISLMLQGRAEEASPLLVEVARQRAESPAAQMISGLGKLQTGDTEEGIRLLEDAAKLAPNDTLVQTALISELVKQEAIEDAINSAKQFAESTGDPAALVLLANAYLASGSASDAERVLLQVLNKDKGNPTASVQLSGLMASRDELEAAQRVLSEALEVHPDNSGLIFRLAAIQDRLGDSEKAAALLEKAAEADESLAAPRVLLARKLLNEGRPDRALAMLSGVDVSKDPIGSMVKADIFTSLNRIGDARIELERIAAMLPDSADVQYRLGIASDALGDLQGARSSITRALTLDPEHAQALVAHARLLAVEGRVDEAVEVLSNAVADPDSFELLAARAFVSRVAGDYESEVEHAKALHERFASDSTVLGLAGALQRSGTVNEGVSVLTAWLESNPAELNVLSELARLHHISGDDKSLIQTLEKILEIDSGNVKALNNLAWQLRSTDESRALQLAREAYKRDSGKIAVVNTYLTVLMQVEDYRTALGVVDTAIGLSHPSQDYQVTKAEIFSRLDRDDEALAVLQGVSMDNLSAEKKQVARALIDSNSR